jgi:putative acetyltransferase
MHKAKALYERSGFMPLVAPLGHTGHTGCNSFYARDL